MTTSPPPVALGPGDEVPTSPFGPLARRLHLLGDAQQVHFNPIHHDEEFARAAGMPGVFGMGLLHGGVLAQRLTAWVGLANIRSFRIRFTGQVWPGDLLSFGGRVTSVREAGGQQVADLELVVTRQTGEPAIKGSAVVQVAR